MNYFCTLYDENFESFIPYTLKTFDVFCEKYGFKPLYFNGLIDKSLHPSWNKLLAIVNAFNKGAEWVFWADADSLFIGKNSSFLNYNGNFLINEDSNGICCSHILIKNTSYNKTLLETLLFLGDVKDETKFGKGMKWEQNALKALQQHFVILTDALPPNFVGEPLYPNTLHPDNQFLHFAVMDNERRFKVIREIYENWNYHTSGWDQIYRICTDAIRNNPSFFTET